jgi:excisionase family DNA binding protein
VNTASCVHARASKFFVFLYKPALTGISGPKSAAFFISKGLDRMNSSEKQTRRRLVDVKGASEYLSVSSWTIREMCWRGDLVFCRVGRLIRLDISDLDRYIEANKQQVGSR